MRWEFILAQATGTSHEERRLPSDDAAMAIRIRDKDGQRLCVVSIADGAGSAKQGGLGARIAVGALLKAARADLRRRAVSACDESTLMRWFERARSAVDDHAWRCAAEMRDFATTLLIAVLGEERCLLAQVGDGAIVGGLAGADGTTAWTPLSWPVHGENPNTTVFLTSDNWRQGWSFSAPEQAQSHIALFSDGLERLALKLAEREAHAPFFDGLFAPWHAPKPVKQSVYARELKRWLQSEYVTSRTDDDCSLALCRLVGSASKR